MKDSVPSEKVLGSDSVESVQEDEVEDGQYDCTPDSYN